MDIDKFCDGIWKMATFKGKGKREVREGLERISNKIWTVTNSGEVSLDEIRSITAEDQEWLNGLAGITDVTAIFSPRCGWFQGFGF